MYFKVLDVEYLISISTCLVVREKLLFLCAVIAILVL